MRLHYFFSLIAHLILYSNLSGQTLWYKTMGGGDYDAGESILVLHDSSIIVAGSTSLQSSDILWVKTDSIGNILNWKAFGWDGIEWAKHIVSFPPDSGFIMVGSTNSLGAGSYDILVARQDRNGDTLWTKTFGGLDWDLGKQVWIDPQDKIWILSHSYSYSNNGCAVIIVLDSNGNELQRTILSANADLRPEHFMLMPDSAILVLGSIQPGIYSEKDIFTAKLNLQGDTVWTKIYGSTFADTPRKILPYLNSSNSLSYMICGEYQNTNLNKSNAFFQRINTNGDSILRVNHEVNFDRINLQARYENNNGVYAVFSQLNLPSFNRWDIDFMRTSFTYYDEGWITPMPGNQYLSDFAFFPGGGFVATGKSDFYGPGISAIFLAKFDINGQTSGNVTVSIEENPEDELFIYPNPTHSNGFEVGYTVSEINSIEIYTISGKKIYTWKGNAQNMRIQTQGWSSGIYFIQVRNHNGIIRNGKISIQ